MTNKYVLWSKANNWKVQEAAMSLVHNTKNNCVTCEWHSSTVQMSTGDYEEKRIEECLIVRSISEKCPSRTPTEQNGYRCQEKYLIPQK